MPFQITDEFIKPYLEGYTSPDYALKLERSTEVNRLLYADEAETLLRQRHPSEENWIYQHRRQNFRLITRAAFYRVLNALGRINKCPDFTIKHTDPDLETYCEQQFPIWGSVRNWAFTKLLQAYLCEPNGVLVVLPEEDNPQRPIPQLFRAEQVIDFEAGKYCILKTDQQTTYQYRGKTYQGSVYWAITPGELWEYRRVADGYEAYQRLTFDWQELPVVLLGSHPYALKYPGVYETAIAGALPYWTEALVQQSDLQGAIKQHIYPEKHLYLADTCQTCQGSGMQSGELRATCHDCKGSGYAMGVYGLTIVRPPRADEPEPKFPAAAYVQKDINSVTFLKQEIADNMLAGFRAINFEFLLMSPVQQSGIAKAYDRQELHAFLYGIARHMIEQLLKPCYRFMGLWRTGKSIEPVLTVPERFDDITPDALEQELTAAQTAGVSAPVRVALEQKLINRRFVADPDVQHRLALTLALDPLAGKTEPEKARLLSTGIITETDYRLSTYVGIWVTELLQTNPDFARLPYPEQLKLLRSKANLT